LPVQIIINRRPQGNMKPSINEIFKNNQTPLVEE
jgi:hypothetical protein